MLESLQVMMPEVAQGRAPQPKPLEAEMGRIFLGGDAHEEKSWLPLGQALRRKGQLSPSCAQMLVGGRVLAALQNRCPCCGVHPRLWHDPTALGRTGHPLGSH